MVTLGVSAIGEPWKRWEGPWTCEEPHRACLRLRVLMHGHVRMCVNKFVQVQQYQFHHRLLKRKTMR